MDVVIQANVSRKKSGGSKKLGRNKKKCARYRLEGRREKNKIIKKARNAKRIARLHQLRIKREEKAA